VSEANESFKAINQPDSARPGQTDLRPEFSGFLNSADCIGKIPSKYFVLQSVIIQKKIWIKKNKKSSEIWEVQVIVFMIMFTRSSERIFNLTRYTGYTNETLGRSVWKSKFTKVYILLCVFSSIRHYYYFFFRYKQQRLLQLGRRESGRFIVLDDYSGPKMLTQI